MEGEWRDDLFSDTHVSLHVFFPTLSEATVAATPWSYIQRVRYKELGRGLLILAMQAPITQAETERDVFKPLKARLHEIKDIRCQIF